MNRFIAVALLTVIGMSTARAQATKSWLCKDGSVASGSADQCATHGGVSSEVAAQKLSSASSHSAATRCKDGTTEFYSDSIETCQGHKGIAFSFPASGMSDSVRRAALKTDSIRAAACSQKMDGRQSKVAPCNKAKP
jgi:hypothetical protein